MSHQTARVASLTEAGPGSGRSGFNWTAIIAVTLIAIWVLTLASSIGITGGWLIDGNGSPQNNDYNNVYTAGQFVLQGEPAAAYDWQRHKQSQMVLTNNPNSAFYPWPYPPIFLFIAALLAMMPYAISMFAWSVGTLALYAVQLYRITATPTHFAILLAMPAVWFNTFVGQNGAFTAALIGCALLLLPVRPVAAGICIGLLAYKPHLGILFPVALAAAGHWRAFVSAGVTVAALILASILAFGIAPWLAMPAQLDYVMSIMKTADSPERLQSVFGLLASLGVAVKTASAAQLALTLTLVAGVAWTWRRRDVPHDLKAALLAAAVTLASPYQFVYDLPVLTLAQAFLLRHVANAGGVRLRDAAVLVLVNACVFLFATTSIPMGFFGCLCLAAYVLRLIRLEMSGTNAPQMRSLLRPAANPARAERGGMRVLTV